SADEKTKIKNQFWQIVRWEYDQTIKNYDASKTECSDKTTKLTEAKKVVDVEITALEVERTEKQKETINIEESIENINKGLV
ncbi:hypothetical protein OFN55_40390, partial [Escherichia coli]|nr:hypothetical protein [Escherichia coli]